MQEHEIYDLQTALLSIKEKSRPAYKKSWEEFVCFFEIPEDLETRAPTESELIGYVQYLRQELKRKSSTIWTTYSELNSVVKGRYGVDLNTYHRLKSFSRPWIRISKRRPTFFQSRTLRHFSEQICQTSIGW